MNTIERQELAADIKVLRAGAADLDREADLLHKTAAVWHGGGSAAFVRAVDEADGYKRQAAELRADAAQAEKWLKEQTEGSQ